MRLLDVVADLVGRFGVQDLDDAAFGHREHVGCLQFAHGVALAQVLVDFDP